MLMIVGLLIGYIFGLSLFIFNYYSLPGFNITEVIIEKPLPIVTVEGYLEHFFFNIQKTTPWELESFKYIAGESLLVDLFSVDIINSINFIITFIYTHWVLVFWHFLHNILVSSVGGPYILELATAKANIPLITDLFIMWFQIISLGILTIWARGVGPRFRPDQLSEITWKDILIYLTGLFLVISYFMLLG